MPQSPAAPIIGGRARPPPARAMLSPLSRGEGRKRRLRPCSTSFEEYSRGFSLLAGGDSPFLSISTGLSPYRCADRSGGVYPTVLCRRFLLLRQARAPWCHKSLLILTHCRLSSQLPRVAAHPLSTGLPAESPAKAFPSRLGPRRRPHPPHRPPRLCHPSPPCQRGMPSPLHLPPRLRAPVRARRGGTWSRRSPEPAPLGRRGAPGPNRPPPQGVVGACPPSLAPPWGEGQEGH